MGIVEHIFRSLTHSHANMHTHTHIHPSSHKNFSKSSVIKLHPSGRNLSLALPPRCAIRREDTMFPWKKIRPNTKPPDLDALAAVATASQSHYRLIKNVDSSTQGKSQPGDLDVYHKLNFVRKTFFFLIRDRESMVKLTCFKSLYHFFLILKCYIELMANKFLKILSS